MATPATTLIQRTRRFLGDWPSNDSITASMATSATSVTVATATDYSQGWMIQVDQEAMYVTANGTGTTVPVRRGQRGSTVLTHDVGAPVLVRPQFLDMEYVDALNSGIGASFPMLYQRVVDESTFTQNAVYEYAVPDTPYLGGPIMYLYEMQFKENADLSFRRLSDWDVLRGASPAVKLKRPLPPGILRMLGFAPLPLLFDGADDLSSLYPPGAEDALTLYASQYLLASGEARRVREDTGARDDRDNANRVGGSMAASQQILQRFQMRLVQVQMPPLPRHIKSVI
jgi:hypothetical protein